MPKHVLTVVTSAKTSNYFYSVHDTEDAAKAEQKEILAELNNPGMPPVRFVQVGTATVKLDDIESTQVTPEDEAPGYGGGFGIA